MICQSVIVGIIIIVAAVGLYFSLKRKQPESSCSGCPLEKECGSKSKKSEKSGSESCTIKK